MKIKSRQSLRIRLRLASIMQRDMTADEIIINLLADGDEKLERQLRATIQRQQRKLVGQYSRAHPKQRASRPHEHARYAGGDVESNRRRH